jgi:hypothetical protein
MRDYQMGLGLPREQVYNQTMYILMGMLAVGLVCNLLIKPLDPKWFMTDVELAQEKQLAHEKSSQGEALYHTSASTTSPLLVMGAWLMVGIPMAWGVYRAMQSVAKFIH